MFDGHWQIRARLVCVTAVNRFLLFSESQTGPICVYAPFDGERDAALAFATIIHSQAWAPRDTTLAGAGIKAARHWQQTPQSVIRNMQARYPKANLDVILVANEPALPSRADMVATLTSVHTCRMPAPRVVAKPPRFKYGSSFEKGIRGVK